MPRYKIIHTITIMYDAGDDADAQKRGVDLLQYLLAVPDHSKLRSNEVVVAHTKGPL